MWRGHKSTLGYPTPPSTASWRSRRAQASSEDSSDSSRRFSISNVKFRVGAPPLRPLPLKSVWDGPCAALENRFGSKLVDRASQILSENGIIDPEVSLTSRMVPGETWTAQPTIFIVAQWSEQSPNIWERSVRQVKKYANTMLIGYDELERLDVCVEMVARELIMPKYLSPIPNDAKFPKLEADWPVIQANVFEILESFLSTASHMTAIALFKLGYNPVYAKNPNTVYISLDYASNETAWPPVVKRIQEYLDGFNHDLHVHIEHNTMDEFAFRLIPSSLNDSEKADKEARFNFANHQKYETQVGLGADIGAARYITREDGQECNALIGTMGCYLEIKSARFPNWKKVALTNYHVVRPAIKGYQLGVQNGKSSKRDPVENSDLWTADLAGVSPNTMPRRETMEHPTRAKHNFVVDQLRGYIAADTSPTPDPITQTSLDDKLAFFDQNKHPFGGVWVGSGYTRRTKRNGRLDWALVMPPDDSRLCNNMLPGRDDWFARHAYSTLLPNWTTFGASLKNPPKGVSLHQVSQGDLVYKVGASTGPTVGLFSKIKVNCTMGEERYMKLENPKSTEYMFIGRAPTNPDGRFGDIGDSGSVVFDREGRAVGLLFTGQTPQQCPPDGYCLVTPIEDVLEDIKAFSKGQITDIRIADP